MFQVELSNQKGASNIYTEKKRKEDKKPWRFIWAIAVLVLINLASWVSVTPINFPVNNWFDAILSGLATPVVSLNYLAIALGVGLLESATRQRTMLIVGLMSVATLLAVTRVFQGYAAGNVTEHLAGIHLLLYCLSMNLTTYAIAASSKRIGNFTIEKAGREQVTKKVRFTALALCSVSVSFLANSAM